MDKDGYLCGRKHEVVIDVVAKQKGRSIERPFCLATL
jgi:hypothetical protein